MSDYPLHTHLHTFTEERGQLMSRDAKIMLNLADFLMQDNLITPEEKLRLTELIRKDHAV